jgi:hypothetical protein
MSAGKASRGMRSMSVRQMRWQTRALLAQHRTIRRATGLAIRQALQRHRAAVVGSLKTAFLGTGTPPPLPAAERAGVWELWPLGGTEPERSTGGNEELLQVARVIQEHPEGICARDIGNELGIDWRRVLGLTRGLVNSGLVEQVEEAYYPATKASRR